MDASSTLPHHGSKSQALAPNSPPGHEQHQGNAAIAASSEESRPISREKATGTFIEPLVEKPVIPKAPDGGLQAWLQVLGGFIIYFNTWGLMISFGVFQDYYENHLLADFSSSSISWIGTLQAFFLIEVGIVTGPLYDRGLLRYILGTGAILLTLGVMFTSIAKEYYSIFLSLGVCTGIGMGCMFFPGVTAINTYFSTKRGIASGVAAAGSGFGAIVYPIVLRELIAHTSFGWAVRAVGFIVFATSLIPLWVMKPLWLPSGDHKHKLFDKAIFKDHIYTLWSLTNVVGWIGLQVPLFYVNVYGEQVIAMSESNAFYLSAILGAGSLPGRIIIALASDRVGPLWVYPASMAMAGIVSLAWIGVTTYAGLIVVVLLYGFAYGGIASLPPSAIAALSTDMSSIGTRIGMSFSFAGVTMLVGPPIAGIIQKSGFKGVFAFAGATVLVGSLLLFGAAYLHRRRGQVRG